MNADPRFMNGRPHQVRPTPQNHYGHPPVELAEDYHELLAVGEEAASRFGTRVLCAALILAAIASAVIFGVLP